MKQQKLSSEKLKAVFEAILELINKIENEYTRKSILEMMEDLGERYFSAPASHRAEFHNCFPGGLAEHTLRVYMILKDLCSKYYPSVSDDTITIVALLHDLGKIGDENGDYYVQQTSDWHRDKLGEFYTPNNSIEYFHHSHRSLYLCQAYQIPLTAEEFKAIMIHDGQYIEANRQYANKEGMLSSLLHIADNLACAIEKENYKKFCKD